MSNKQSYTISDFYERYKQSYGDKVDLRLYTDILSKFNTIIANKLLSGSEELKMPYSLGSVCIVKYKPKTHLKKSLSIDFKATRDLGRNVYHLNDHSDGYKYRLFWSKQDRDCFNIYLYQLKLLRANKRRLASIIKNKENDFQEL